ncbi:MAG: ATP synthase F1 subunit gamma [Candidatus Parcubacteria bacterium]|nr:ATP synthase F1 subunit gamma [Candidatus Parcubacteria bacterium]
MPNTRDIRRRIKSIHNTKKITKAMEMVASSKMRRAVKGVLASRPYSDLAWQLITHVAGKAKITANRLLDKRKEIKAIGIVLVTSNRGLCGSFNQQVIKKTVEIIKKGKALNQDLKIEIICVGKKGGRSMLRLGYKVVAEFDKPDILNNVSDVRPMAKLIMSEFLKKKYDKVFLVYTDYISALKQVPQVKQILPIEAAPDFFEKVSEQKVRNFEYKFEPPAKEILAELLPRLLTSQVFQAYLESNASEQSARMISMRNASDAAGDMINELTLIFNQARQSAITREIAEIAGGKAALE